jgi:hypothetical protein
MEVRVNSGTTYAAEVPSGLVAWWPGNHTTEEKVSGRREVGVNVAYATGRVGGAFSFDATSRNVVVPRSSGQTDLGAGAAGFTIEFWMRRTAADSGTRRLLSWERNNAESIFCYSSGGTVGLHLPWVIDLSVSGVGTGWTHVAFAYDRTTRQLRYYLGGVLMKLDILTTSQAESMAGSMTGDLYMGGLPARSSGEWYHGQLDELSFYNRAITPTEVALIAAAGAEGKLPLDDNQAPVVSAGPDRALTSASGAVTLLGQASDDGLPGGFLDVRWTQLFGPASAPCAAPPAARTEVTLPQPGLYGFQLAGSDGFITRRDVAEVRVQQTGAAEVPSGLVAWWPGNHTTEEMVTGRLDAGVNVAYATGRVGGAFSFDATSRNVVVPRSSGQTDLGAGAAGFTIEFWMRRTAADSGTRRLLSWERNNAESIFCYSSGGTVGLHLPWVIDLSVSGLGTGWTHVAFAYDRTTRQMRYYLGGVLVKLDTLTTSQAESMAGSMTGDLYMGGLPARSSGEWYHGQLDELSFYNRAITPTEVALIARL